MPDNPNEIRQQVLNGREALRTALDQLLEQSQRTLLLFADDLDASLYSHDYFVERISSLARNTRRPEIRLLLHRPSELLSQQHRALPIIQRLSSLIEVKSLHQQYHGQHQSYVINDEPRMLYQASSERYEAILTEEKYRIAETKKQFNQMWQQSIATVELRRQML